MKRVFKFMLALLVAASPWFYARAQSINRGPYLQMGGATAITVKWSTDAATDSIVRYGTSASSLTRTAPGSGSVTSHEVRLTGLTPNTKYFYSVGSSAGTLASGSTYYFVTAPTNAKPTRIWAIGDAGTADSNQKAVRDAYYNYTGSRETDLWLMLGDNAYVDGTDAEYQSAVFDIYPTLLRKSVVWPTMGNHDGYSSTSSSQSGPYFSIFSLPKNAEVGGVASGTEAYYSYDYGNIHFICLDSEGSSRSSHGTMLEWLRLDLAATTKDWIIAYWHHPPYTKGSHDSDTETNLIDMRQNALPILEAGGVDLVLTGHSHSYERSYLLDGHYGTSDTLTSAMKVDSGDGRENGTGAYSKPGGGAANEGAVYIVAGSSGKLESGGSLNHPAMFISLSQLGSVVVDINGNRMDVKFVRSNGAVADYFTITKASAPPTPTGLLAAAGSGQVSLNWTAPTNATSYKIKRATTSGGPYTTIGTVTNTSYLSTGLTNGTTYYYVVSAVNAAGESANSSQVSATPLPPLPPAPTGLGASAGNSQVTLNWTASTNATSYKIKRATTSGGPYTTVGTVTNTSYLSTGLTNGTTYYYVVSAVNAAGESANSSQVSATPLPPLPPAPTGLGASAGNSQVTLNWTASTNATSYKIKRATTSGGPYTTVGTVTNTSYLSTGLTNGTTYYCVVSAVNAAGESANSSQVSATPTAPASIRLTIGLDASRRPVLSWNSASGKIYRVAYKNNLTDANWTNLSGNITASAATTTWTDTIASPSVKRFYAVYQTP